MKILLINDNPVVSRLFILCMQEEGIEFNETYDLKLFDNDNSYDIVFVDDASYTFDVNILKKMFSMSIKIFISFSEEDMMGFDKVIKKPFLPLRVMEIIGERRDSLKLNKENDTKSNNRVLDTKEIEKIKLLLEMDEEEISLEEEELNDEEYEFRKMEVIKEQLIAEGLDIVEEKEIFESLSKKKKVLKYTKKEQYEIGKTIEVSIARLKPKKIKKLLKGKKIKLSIKLKVKK